MAMFGVKNFKSWHLPVLIVAIWIAVSVIRKEPTKENATLRTPELLKKYGYPSETHKIITGDGYIVTMHRIPHGKNNLKPSKGAVYMMHGIICSSASWVVTGPENGLGFILADAGYDVWMGNARGNLYSRNHTQLNPDTDNDFWKYSWHEIGTEDMTSMIDYILEKTGEKKVFFIGYSQGNTGYYVMASTKPEYNEKIHAHYSLAPTVYMDHMTSPTLKYIAMFMEYFLTSYISEFLPRRDFNAVIADFICGDQALTQPLCAESIFYVVGHSYTQMNSSNMPLMMGQSPSGTSTRQFTHYAQVYSTGSFKQYDHGIEENLIKYNNTQPPIYDLAKITADTYLLYSTTDTAVHIIDVDRLCNELGNCKEKYAIPQESFNHLDFIYGLNAPEFVYGKLLQSMDSYYHS